MARGTVVYRGLHVTVRYDPDRRSIARCAMGPELSAAVVEVAQNKAQPYAISISPRSDEEHLHYQDAFVVQLVVTGAVAPESIGKPPMERVGARLYNTAPHAAAVEWGNSSVGADGHRVLGRTLDYLNSFHS